jgi:hypothetical protein
MIFAMHQTKVACLATMAEASVTGVTKKMAIMQKQPSSFKYFFFSLKQQTRPDNFTIRAGS